MADLFHAGSATSSLNLDTGATVGVPDTGDLRRKYNFGDQVSELALAQDPFFRFVSKVAKKPTDDPLFKFTEKRPSWHKRYAYIAAVKNNAGAFVATSDFGAAKTVDSAISVRMISDFKSEGNVQEVFGNSSKKIVAGSSGTMPKFFLPGQIVKIPTAATAGGAVAGYMLMKVNTVTEYAIGASYNAAGNASNDATVTTTNNPEMVQLDGTVVRIPLTSDNAQFVTAPANFDQGLTDTFDKEIAGTLEQDRCYVIGNAFAEGSGYPETWKDQPFTTGNGNTQIWKTTCAMTNTARATALRYEQNEWARIWKEKLVEHKYDIEQSLLFGASSVSAGGSNTTQGAVDYILSNGNIFSWSTTKTADDFLDDMSNYLDPRYNSSVGTVFFCSTAVYNWLHKLGGYFKANMEISSNFSADLAVTGRKKVLGLDVTEISTPFGNMNLVRNIHLDGTDVSMLGINLKYCAYRPLVGNGVNRDTSIYVGVQTLENSGVDRRVDQILTEAGMEWSMAECHAIWK